MFREMMKVLVLVFVLK